MSSPLGYRGLPAFPLASCANPDTNDWLPVAESGPRCCDACSFIACFLASVSRRSCSKILVVSACASLMAASIPSSNSTGIDTFEAPLAAATLGPMDGGGGGPLLDDAAWNKGALK